MMVCWISTEKYKWKIAILDYIELASTILCELSFIQVKFHDTKALLWIFFMDLCFKVGFSITYKVLRKLGISFTDSSQGELYNSKSTQR